MNLSALSAVSVALSATLGLAFAGLGAPAIDSRASAREPLPAPVAPPAVVLPPPREVPSAPHGNGSEPGEPGPPADDPPAANGTPPSDEGSGAGSLVEFHFPGHITCSLGFYPFESRDLCTTDWLPGEGDAGGAAVPLEPGLDAVVLELRWEAEGPGNLGKHLGFIFWAPAGVPDHHREGVSPLAASFDLRSHPLFDDPSFNGTTGRISVRSASDGPLLSWSEAGGLVLDQDYDLYLGLFYAGRAVPEGYSPAASFGA